MLKISNKRLIDSSLPHHIIEWVALSLSHSNAIKPRNEIHQRTIYLIIQQQLMGGCNANRLSLLHILFTTHLIPHDIKTKESLCPTIQRFATLRNIAILISQHRRNSSPMQTDETAIKNRLSRKTLANDVPITPSISVLGWPAQQWFSMAVVEQGNNINNSARHSHIPVGLSVVNFIVDNSIVASTAAPRVVSGVAASISLALLFNIPDSSARYFTAFHMSWADWKYWNGCPNEQTNGKLLPNELLYLGCCCVTVARFRRRRRGFCQ